jgi:hypothetical protein
MAVELKVEAAGREGAMTRPETPKRAGARVAAIRADLQPPQSPTPNHKSVATPGQTESRRSRRKGPQLR